ncbi:MAG: isoprenylcysteine carboxylmethyltransferase family protein [Chromatiales bacterium]|nr:isoprenylcysteine carboxylmethyltransferase family protein [Chromatiales bacterium]
MYELWIIILIHQLIFQGMFVTKNIILAKKIGESIRGKNIEATIASSFFGFFIVTSLVIGLFKPSFAELHLVSSSVATTIGIVLILLNLVISATSLVNLRDSWRVGVLEGQKTELVTSGIYRFSRNPYFASYFTLFVAYTVMTQSLILLALSIIGFLVTHKMVLKEEAYLSSAHGVDYENYKNSVPRYLIV